MVVALQWCLQGNELWWGIVYSSWVQPKMAPLHAMEVNWITRGSPIQAGRQHAAVCEMLE